MLVAVDKRKKKIIIISEHALDDIREQFLRESATINEGLLQVLIHIRELHRTTEDVLVVVRKCKVRLYAATK